MMADCGWSKRGGETLGDYKDWAFSQSRLLEVCNERQRGEREFYKED